MAVVRRDRVASGALANGVALEKNKSPVSYSSSLLSTLMDPLTPANSTGDGDGDAPADGREDDDGAAPPDIHDSVDAPDKMDDDRCLDPATAGRKVPGTAGAVSRRGGSAGNSWLPSVLDGRLNDTSLSG